MGKWFEVLFEGLNWWLCCMLFLWSIFLRKECYDLFEMLKDKYENNDFWRNYILMSVEDVVNGKKLKWIELEIMVWLICNLSLILW